jgi:beta-glucuronidase
MLLLPAAAAAAAPPASQTLGSGWEVRVEPGQAPAEPQQPPPEEGDTDEPATAAGPTVAPPASISQLGPEQYVPTRVPSVFDTRALPQLYPGSVRRYRLRFTGPVTPRGITWLLRFEGVRRAADVFLNGRRIGRHSDPYTPFTITARGLRPGRENELIVIVDNRKNPELAEGWWNWGGIVRPVRLVAVGSASLQDLGYVSKVRCRGRASRCSARVAIVGRMVNTRGRGRIRPRVNIRLRAPGGRVTRRSFLLPLQRARSRTISLELPVRGPQLWSPERPQLYSVTLALQNGGATTQVDRRRIGLRQVQVKRGGLYLNNRRIRLRGASIHEDMPGNGAALSSADNGRIVTELQQLGANVTRAHYLLNEDLLERLDRAGIMVWNQAPIWQRDHRANLLRRPVDRARAVKTVEDTVIAARSHPSVITHSVANELTFFPDAKVPSRLFLVRAARQTRALDPTLPVSVDIKGRPGVPEQFTYAHFDMIGANIYFGWYRGAGPISDMPLYLQEMRDLYPDQALVATEFGAEAPAAFSDRPLEFKGSHLFQREWARQSLEQLDRASYLSGAIYWTLREFEIYPGWTGGGPAVQPNTRHHKAVITYEGEKKPAWQVLHDHFARYPLYAP